MDNNFSKLSKPGVNSLLQFVWMTERYDFFHRLASHGAAFIQFNFYHTETKEPLCRDREIDHNWIKYQLMVSLQKWPWNKC